MILGSGAAGGVLGSVAGGKFGEKHITKQVKPLYRDALRKLNSIEKSNKNNEFVRNLVKNKRTATRIEAETLIKAGKRGGKVLGGALGTGVGLGVAAAGVVSRNRRNLKKLREEKQED